jgi:hypothetical protein
VVDAGVRASDYASYLLGIADARAEAHVGRALAVGILARPPHLDARIRRLLAGGAAPTASRPASLRVAMWLGGAWVLLLGSVRLSVPREALWHALDTDRGAVRAYAAMALAHSRDRQVRDSARGRALADPDPLVRRI